MILMRGRSEVSPADQWRITGGARASRLWFIYDIPPRPRAQLSAARQSANRNDFALVAMLGLLGLRIFEATCADIGDLGEEHVNRVLRVCGEGSKVVLVPLPPAVGRAIDRAVSGRSAGPILL